MKKRIKEILFNKNHFDLQYVIAIALIGVMMVASVVALLVNTVSLDRQLQRNMEGYANDTTAQLASEISSKMTMRNTYIVNLAESISIMGKDKVTETQLSHNVKRMDMEDIFIVNENGETFSADQKHDDFGKYFLENPQLFQEPQVFFTELNEIFYSAPIHWEDGNAVLIGVRNKEGLQDMLAKVAERCEGLCCIVDSSGQMVVSATDEQSFRALYDLFNQSERSDDQREAQTVMQNVRDGQSGVALFENIAAEPVMLGYDFLNINDWVLLTLVPTSQFSVGVDAHLIRYIAILFVMVVLMGLIFFYMVGVYRRSLKRIQSVALTDALTGGNNGQAFCIEGERLLKENPNRMYAVVYLNIRNFKRLNERFGVRVSDEILKSIYEIVQADIQDNEFMGRSVGDHYYMLLQADSEAQVQTRLEAVTLRLVEELSDRYLIDRSRINYGAYMVQDRNVDMLLMQSWAKVASTYVRDDDICSFYDEAIEAELAWENQLEDDFERAIANHEFKLFVQPKVSLHEKGAHSGEVLVRWEHPEHGMIPPGRFIPIFERDGKICDLDFYMFEESCKLLRSWMDEGCAVPLSVNLSRAHVVDDDMAFLNRFKTLKEQYAIPDGMIELELTESIMLESREMSLVVSLIDRIRAMGFLCSIDDFGSGYSSLSILKDLNVSTVKLDRQFFIDENDKTWRVVQQMMNLAHDLNMTVVAEGIEDIKQAEKLWKLGCDLIQGYVFAKPMPAEIFKKWSFEGN